jgi:hypothetical protein
MTRPRLVATVALPILAGLKAREREYAEECAQWSRQGYRPHYCIHGTNLWVDYDNICAGCEDGRSVYEQALDGAHAAIAESNRRRDVMSAMLIAAIEACAPAASDVPQQAIDALVEWALEPVA